MPIPHITRCGSIFYPQVQRAEYFARTFAFRPQCFQYFTRRGGGGGGTPSHGKVSAIFKMGMNRSRSASRSFQLPFKDSAGPPIISSDSPSEDGRSRLRIWLRHES